MFHLGIEFGTEQHNDGRYPQPNHETDDRAERARLSDRVPANTLEARRNQCGRGHH
jgi:hypothetical protein